MNYDHLPTIDFGEKEEEITVGDKIIGMISLIAGAGMVYVIFSGKLYQLLVWVGANGF